MKAFADAIGLWALCFCLRVVDVWKGQIELVLVLILFPAVLRSTVGQDSKKRNPLLLIERYDTIVSQVSSCDGVFLQLELRVYHARVGIDERLLVRATDAFECSHVKRVLCTKVAWVSSFNLTMSFLLEFGLLKCSELTLSKNHAILSNLCLKSLKPLLHGLQVVPKPDYVDTAR